MSRGSRIFLPKLQLDPVQLRRGVVPGRSPFGPRQFSDGEQLTAEQASPAPQGRRKKHEVPPEYIGDPIHLTASVTGLNAGSAGTGVNVKALVNPGPGAIEIFELKFRIRTATLVPSGALVACRLDLGDFQLTNGFIPVYSFGRAENLILEQVVGSGTPSNGSPLPDFAYAQYIARLSRPIYVPPGAVIRPQLQHRGQANAAVDVQVSMVGRMLPPDAPPPRKLILPFWAAYNCKTFTVGTLDTDTSSETDLINPFDSPLYMDRFVGRIGYYSSATAAFLGAASMIELEQSPFNVSGTSTMADALGMITCKITDSNGYPVVKKLTPFRLVFDAETRSWPIPGVMLPPNGYYLVEMANAGSWPAGTPTEFSSAAVFAQPAISMLGWREVA